jgi:ferric-dicitrate binding protein FerR (iron transport regulator)
MSEPDPLLDEALDWLVRLRTGEPTRADIEDLKQWRGRSAAHEDAFKRAAQIYRHAGIAAVELAVEQASKPQAPANPRRHVLIADRAMSKAVISYIRVSTAGQGRSGLGLEAQREAIARFAKDQNYSIAAEYVEVESAKGADALERRPELAKAW